MPFDSDQFEARAVAEVDRCLVPLVLLADQRADVRNPYWVHGRMDGNE